MKKLIAVVLAVVLVAGGLGGLAYAQTNGHEPMTGQKLVGYGFYGTHDLEELDDATYDLHTMFTFTNPDGVSEISIERISIYAEDGKVMYEGPLLHPDGKTPWTEPMEPHETRFVIAFPPGIPMLPDLTMPLNAIIIEIFWSWTEEEGLPLTGWQQSGCLRSDAEGNLIDVGVVWEAQMVNME